MTKEIVKIVIVGHVDHGKSTLIGRLLLDTHSLPKEKISEIKRISKELGKDTELAYVTDQLKEERERNITIDTTQIFFKTHKRDYVIIDAPGHVEFIKNMITGASLADCAVLIVDAQEGVMEQTRRHAYLISMLGLKNVIVLFNKMDLVGYEEERFEKVKRELLRFLENLNIHPAFSIPVSAKTGDNVSKSSRLMGWHKGPTLLKALDAIRLKRKETRSVLVFPVQDIYEIEGKKIIVGKVVAGEIAQGQRVVFLPSGREAEVKSIEFFGGDRKKACEGENIGLVLEKSFPVERGEIIAGKEKPPRPVTSFRGDIFWMSDEPLTLGRKITLRCVTQEVGCTVEKIEKRINSSTLEIIEENARTLKLNEVGVATLKTEKPVVVENFSLIDELGRFTLERESELKAAGIVSS